MNDAVDIVKATGMKKRSGIKKPTIKAIHLQMNNTQLNSPNGWSDTVLNPNMPDGHKLVILIQTLGLVAAAMQAEAPENLTEELIRLAAVSAGWAESSRKGKTQWTTT
jgi:hypothetical protein